MPTHPLIPNGPLVSATIAAPFTILDKEEENFARVVCPAIEYTRSRDESESSVKIEIEEMIENNVLR